MAMQTLDNSQTNPIILGPDDFPFYDKENMSMDEKQIKLPSDIPQGIGSRLDSDTLDGYQLSTAVAPTPNTVVPLNTAGQYPVSTMSKGTVVQTVYAKFSSLATGTTTIPMDDTIPQITEGNEYMTLSITPLSITNRLIINASLVYIVHEAATGIAIFRDATANALTAVYTYISNVNKRSTHVTTIQAETTANSLASTTFRVRAGVSGGGEAFTFNGSNSGVNPPRAYGGVMGSFIRITEIQT